MMYSKKLPKSIEVRFFFFFHIGMSKCVPQGVWYGRIKAFNGECSGVKEEEEFLLCKMYKMKKTLKKKNKFLIPTMVDFCHITQHMQAAD